MKGACELDIHVCNHMYGPSLIGTAHLYYCSLTNLVMRRFLPLSERFLINYVDDDHTQTLGFDYGASVTTFIILCVS